MAQSPSSVSPGAPRWGGDAVLLRPEKPRPSNAAPWCSAPSPTGSSDSEPAHGPPRPCRADHPGHAHSPGRAWTTLLITPRWWSLSWDDLRSYRSGAEFGFWTSRQVRRSGLCLSCWMCESEPDIRVCDGGDCRNFGRLLASLLPET